jgi:hypothetical protein
MTALAQRIGLSARGKGIWRNLQRPMTLDAALALAVFTLALAVYNATLTPSLSFASFDGNELATVPHQLGLAHSTGYPLYTWVGKLFTFLPVGDVAHRMNLMSAVGAAGAAALVYGSLRLLDVNRVASLFGGLFLAFSITLWSQAVITEVYAPNAFMLALTLFLVLAWGRRERARGSPAEADLASALLFYGFCLAYGLSLGTHSSNLALAPAIAAYVLLVNWRVLAQPLTIVVGAALFLLGTLQYLWLPVKASTLLDVPMARNAPNTWEGFYNYTLNSFPQLKFAFPWEAIPDRIVLYLQITRYNFGLLGMALALWGMWEMLWRQTKAFYLLIIIYVIEVGFFIQYSVFDLDVFFIPAHLIVALFVGYAAHRLIAYVLTLAGRFPPATRPAYTGLALLAAFPLAVLVHSNWEYNDRSDDTIINDFYEQVFEILPPDSVLVGWRGVLGYDMFYFRLVYDRRPDVLIPMLSSPTGAASEANAGSRPSFTTVQPMARKGLSGAGGAFTPPPQLLPDDLWYVPVLAAPMADTGVKRRGFALTLYEGRSQPPELVVSDAQPEHIVDYDFEGLRLVGYDMDDTNVAPGGSIHLTLYWEMKRPAGYTVVTKLDDSQFRETHWLGFGNLERYLDEFQPGDGLIVEEYDLLVPSSTDEGRHTLRVGQLQGWLRGSEESETLIDMAEIVVSD